MAHPQAQFQSLRDLPWMTDDTWAELSSVSTGCNHLVEIGEFLRSDPTNGRQLVHVISHRLEKTLERLLSMGASADEQAYGPGEVNRFHPLDRAVGASRMDWSPRIADMLFSASRTPFSQRNIRPFLSCAIETPRAVAWCLDRGANPDQQSKARCTALSASAQSHDKHTSIFRVRQSFRLLIDAGADLDAIVSHPNGSADDAPCMTAVGCAMWARRWPLAKLLLARGANPDLGGDLSARSLARRDDFSPALIGLSRMDAFGLHASTPRTPHSGVSGRRL